MGDNVNVGTAQPYFFIRKKLWRRALGGVRRAAAASCEGWMTQVVPRTDVTVAHSSEPALRVPARVPLLCVLGAVRALALHSRAARLRAGRVVHLCSVLPDHAASARQRHRHRGALDYIVRRSLTLPIPHPSSTPAT